MIKNSIKPLLLVILTSLIVLSYGINLPFAGQHDWNSVMYANVARNHLRYGLKATKLGMVTRFGYDRSQPFGYFTHYPPLMPLLLALSFAIFGVVEWAGRLVPILCSTMMIAYLFKLAKNLFSTKTALITSFFLIFSPMLLYYSKIPVHETVVLGFLGFTFWNYVRWLKSQQNKHYYLVLLGLILCQLTSWPGYYLSLWLPLHLWIFNQKQALKHKNKLLIIFSLAWIMFGLHQLHMGLIASPHARQTLWTTFIFRLNWGKQAEIFQINLFKFISLQARWMVVYFTRIMTSLSLIWLIIFIKDRLQHKKLQLSESIIFLLFVFGFTHNLIFRNLAHIHDYMLIYALPFFALSSGVILSKVHKRLSQHTRYATLIIIFVLSLFASERITYVKALFNSGNNNPAIALGKTLSQITQVNDIIIVLSTDFMQFHDVFIRYYADRSISAANSLSAPNISQADYLVIPKTHDNLRPQNKYYLYTTYPHFDAGGGIIFNTKNKK